MPHNPNESPEILLLAGAPWSGKSTLAQAVIELGSPRDIRHVSAGNLKRSIVAGKTPSRYAAELQSGKNVERKIGTDLGEFGTGIPDTLIPKTDLMTGIIEEFIDEHPDGLTIVDGFPRYPNGVEAFRTSMEKIGANVLAVCVIDTPISTLRERSKLRPNRENQDPSFSGDKYAEQRIADHFRNVMPTIGMLATIYPLETLDGLAPINVNAAQVLSTYDHYSQRS